MAWVNLAVITKLETFIFRVKKWKTGVEEAQRRKYFWLGREVLSMFFTFCKKKYIPKSTETDNAWCVTVYTLLYGDVSPK